MVIVKKELKMQDSTKSKNKAGDMVGRSKVHDKDKFANPLIWACFLRLFTLL
jgi:hypothetical protein